ncbi:hypothetical protein NKR23_g11316 [Pleurostoma richardsiae]|uniref:CCD97-like C-terminal domain-containing protein n=1 Tax=Pleurostoma richardsiae TaxID=41990 RepID=A0AA38RHU8_9PEZI|nr:hypothetical protein NKR23_g11316 [Pleurostoma richardsiae]
MSPAFDSPSRASPDLFSQPKPRPPKSPAQAAQVRIKNRRREYLDRHPEYFNSTEHELADPLLYDALIRRFQTPAEREAESKAKGYSGVLETSLLRGEARLEQLAKTTHIGGAQHAQPDSAESAEKASSSSSALPTAAATAARVPALPREAPDTNFTVETDLAVEPPASREEAQETWEEFLRDRFVHGRDEDFDYAGVDENDELDVLERRDQEEAWFDDEDPGWASDGSGDDGGEGGKMVVERRIEGETGVQDF